MRAKHLVMLGLALLALQACGDGDDSKGKSNTDIGKNDANTPSKEEQILPKNSPFAKISDGDAKLASMKASLPLPADFDSSTSGMGDVKGSKGDAFPLLKGDYQTHKLHWDLNKKDNLSKGIYTIGGNYAGFAIYNTATVSPETLKSSTILGVAGLDTGKEDWKKLVESKAVAQYKGVAKGFRTDGMDTGGTMTYSIDFATQKGSGKVNNVASIYGSLDDLDVKKGMTLHDASFAVANDRVQGAGKATVIDKSGKAHQLDYEMRAFGPQGNEIAGVVKDPKGDPKVGMHATRIK